MKIHVTEEDIKIGVRGNCGLCPIAFALRREGFRSPKVFGVVGYDRGTDMVYARLPTRAFRFMMRFDAGKPVKPFTFLLAASPDYKPVNP